MRVARELDELPEHLRAPEGDAAGVACLMRDASGLRAGTRPQHQQWRHFRISAGSH
jgi:hypothetical protein